MYTNNPYAQGGWYNPENSRSINNGPWCPNALHPPTFGALPPSKTNPSILTFEFSSFQPDILNSVVTGPDNREFFQIRTTTPACTRGTQPFTLQAIITKADQVRTQELPKQLSLIQKDIWESAPLCLPAIVTSTAMSPQFQIDLVQKNIADACGL